MEDEIYYVDTRNADPRDHRVRPGAISAIVPARTVTRVRPGYESGSTVAYAQPTFPQAQVFAPAPVYAAGPVYNQPPMMGQVGNLFGGLNLGAVIQLAAEAFAAFKSLPAAPSPTGDVATDLANDVLYQSALAREVQLRKQIEFGGHLGGYLGWGAMGAR